MIIRGGENHPFFNPCVPVEKPKKKQNLADFAYFATHFRVKQTKTYQKPQNICRMDFKQIQELIKIINKSNIGELSIEEKEFKITIKQKEEHVQTIVAQPAIPTYTAAPQPVNTPAVPAATSAAGSAAPATPAGGGAPKADNLITIKSPMIGTFYRRPSPDKPIFVEVGDEIAPGKVVCIIEAMKLFNEIESEISGKVVKVLVDDASPVEYDQPLFLVEPA